MYVCVVVCVRARACVLTGRRDVAAVADEFAREVAAGESEESLAALVAGGGTGVAAARRGGSNAGGEEKAGEEEAGDEEPDANIGDS